MLNQEDLKVKLTRRAVLLDTNVLSDAARATEAFSDFFALLENTEGAQPAYSQIIRLEYLKGLYQPELREARDQLLTSYDFFEIPQKPFADHVNEAVRISQALARHQCKPSERDCLIMALMTKYKNNIALVTRNHKDFDRLLERVAVFCVDKGNSDVLALGIYHYSEERMSNLNLL